MSSKQQIQASECEAVTAAESAALCGVSIRHWWSLYARKLTPSSIRLGRSRRWLRSELLDWLHAGCPHRDDWERRKAVRS